ncbi:hypothetical protein [Sabulicella glaciei]|uniref:Halocarboxylic acid dehydrogenase DehI n=1 Tax=Sabulicella glaciei TaxID=2984948 RepID=A0ABT3P1C0_9PROT|nr:hypothetical protein [Roseococcus sp. MDT2-1-1]MCW8088186.1 hypothetical protein [Roseococcus sp. MDT2-1-1]
MTLPEIREADAPPEAARIYDGIRAASGLPLVNLIWRHFAALPGVLPWAWEVAGPVVRSAQMDAARQRLAARPSLPALAPVDWNSVGCGEAEIARIRAIVLAYTRGNLTNLLALTALRMRLQEPDAPAARLEPTPGIPAAPDPIDPLPRLAELGPGVARAVQALSSRHDVRPGVIPSLYLHLAPWPAILDALPVWLGPLYAPGALEQASAAIRRHAEEEARLLMPGTTPPPAGSGAEIRSALDEFTGRVIPDLSTVCLALHGLLPQQGGEFPAGMPG